mgnify:FL=1
MISHLTMVIIVFPIQEIVFKHWNKIIKKELIIQAYY